MKVLIEVKDIGNCKFTLLETMGKQHEAMRRALHLAERNKELEKDMREIDQIALEVESECNSKVRHNSEKVQRYVYFLFFFFVI